MILLLSLLVLLPLTSLCQDDSSTLTASGEIISPSFSNSWQKDQPLAAPVPFPLYRPTAAAQPDFSFADHHQQHSTPPQQQMRDERLISSRNDTKIVTYTFAGPLTSNANTRQPLLPTNGGGMASNSPPSSLTAHGPDYMDACRLFKCENNGKCIMGEDAKPFCVCQQGFSGQRCEINLCTSIKCAVEDGSRQCKVRNGRARCECADGEAGEVCRKGTHRAVFASGSSSNTNTPPLTSTCPYECLNGGRCIPSPSSSRPNSPSSGVCQCTGHFLGANCNIQNLCADNRICGQFGEGAKCVVDKSALAGRLTQTISISPHMCMCPGGEGWVDCNDLPRGQGPSLPIVKLPPPTTARPALVSTTPIREIVETEHVRTPPPAAVPLARPFQRSSTPSPPSQEEEERPDTGGGGRAVSFQPIREINSSRVNLQQLTSTPPPPASPQFPIHSHTPIRSSSSTSNDQSESPSASSGSSSSEGPHFPIVETTPPPTPSSNSFHRMVQVETTTNATSTTRLPEIAPISSSSGIQAPTITNGTTTTIFLPSPITTTTTPPPSPPGIDGDEDERAGDNGFERITQLGGGGEAETTTSTPSAADPNATTTPFLPFEEHGGAFTLQPSSSTSSPETNQVVDEVVETSTTMSTVEEPFNSTTSSSSTTTTRPNEAVLQPEEAHQSGRSPSNTSTNNNSVVSWMIAVGVISLFLLSVLAGTLCVGRYVRRSRRLHGKYNPAREEIAVASTYSMPMTSVGKEERLI